MLPSMEDEGGEEGEDEEEGREHVEEVWSSKILIPSFMVFADIMIEGYSLLLFMCGSYIYLKL
jgi:hypothetical protein